MATSGRRAKRSASNMPAASAYPQRPAMRGSRVPTAVWMVLLLCALIAGLFVGHFVFREKVNFGKLNGQTVITEKQLDDAVATYVYEGETYEVTARDAIAQASSLDSVTAGDGKYLAPSAESVLSAARTAILMREVDARGITVSDEELIAYATSTFGTDDIASLAGAYGMDETTIRDRLRESAAIAKLRAEVVTPAVGEPTQPTPPEDGDPATVSADYAAYIIGLAGAEWDSANGIWASPDGPYATALQNYDVRSDAASYEAAQTAYNVAYQQYSEGAVSEAQQWTSFVNERLCKAKLAMSSLAS